MTKEQALKEVFDELSKMSDKEFRTELKKHGNGDIAKALKELTEMGWEPEICHYLRHASKKNNATRGRHPHARRRRNISR